MNRVWGNLKTWQEVDAEMVGVSMIVLDWVVVSSLEEFEVDGLVLVAVGEFEEEEEEEMVGKVSGSSPTFTSSLASSAIPLNIESTSDVLILNKWYTHASK